MAQFLPFLERLFNTLLLWKDVYHKLYPDSDQQRYTLCMHNPNWQHSPGHPSEMARQGERLASVGVLLRTAEHIRYLKASRDFPSNLENLKDEHPGIAHGVAILNFITAGLCKNDYSTLRNLLNLVKALRGSCKKCKHHHSSSLGKLTHYYNQRHSNRTLILIVAILDDHCKTCYSEHGIKNVERSSHKCLDKTHWHGCRDCESMLVDILAYTNMLSNTHKRMMASLRLSLRCEIDPRQRRAPVQEEELALLSDYLFKKGFTKVKYCGAPALGSTCLEQYSLDYEAIYISGWHCDKKDDFYLLLEGFLEERLDRLFSIQLRYQFEGNDECAHCCEPQIMEHLEIVICELHRRHLTRFIKMHLMLEQDPCADCRSVIMPVILTHLGEHVIPTQLISMLEYVKQSVFLKRLTCGNDPVLQLKSFNEERQPFGNGHSCIVCGGCRYIRYHSHFITYHNTTCLCLGRYSKPSIALTVDMYRLRYHHYTSDEQYALLTDPRSPVLFHWVSSLIRSPTMN